MDLPLDLLLDGHSDDACAPPERHGRLREALALHHAGRAGDAEAAYRAILAAPSAHARASYGLGVLCQAQGRHAEAAAAYRRAIAIDPGDADAINNLAVILMDAGEPREAVPLLRHAATLRPAQAMAQANLGKALQDCGEHAAAADAYAQAIALEPDNAMAHANLAGVSLLMEAPAAAARAAAQAAALAPGMAIAHANLAVALFRLGRRDEARTACLRAAGLRPAEPIIDATLGGVLLELGSFAAAAAVCQRAAAIDPAMAMAHYNLAHACKALNDIDMAERACNAAIALSPDCAEYHFLLAHLLLLRGDRARGWAEYAWRWQLPGFRWLREFAAEAAVPAWQGEDLRGRTILLLAEQGLGDIILAARYAPMLADRGVSVIVACEPPMRRLLGSLRGVSVCDRAARPLPRHDFYCPLMSVACAFDEAADAGPYLHAEPAERARWRGRLGTGVRVGLVWGGNPQTKYDAFRSPGLAALLPLLELADITFVLLQVGPARADLTGTALGRNVIDAGAELEDLASTAAVMMELDLVISSCTAPLHLAGALGVAAWALLPFAPYFPWGLDRDGTGLYPTMRLFRQEAATAGWGDVVARVAQALRERADGPPEPVAAERASA